MPWLTKNISRHIRMRNAAFQTARKSAKPAQFFKYKKLRNKVVKMVKSANSSYFKNLNPSNKKCFWKAVKYLNKQQSTIPTLTYQDTTAQCDSEKASLINEFSQHVSTVIFLLSHLRIMTFILCNTTYVQSSSFVPLMKFSFLPSHWICQKLMGLMGSQLKCLKVRHTALPHLLPSFLIFLFAKVISLSAGRHLLLFQFPNLHVSVKPPTIDQYLYFQ